MLPKLSYPSIKSSLVSNSEKDFTLTIEPLLPGFGHTLGNSIRRVMLSSIPGFGVTKVRINDVTHEYQSVEAVKEDVLDVVLNLKSLRAEILTDDDAVTLKINTKKKGDITAAMFAKDSSIKIINEDLYICHLGDDKELNIEVEIARGFGYTPYEERELAKNTEPTSILIDTLFSPVRNVSLNVDQVRVGDQTNFDKVVVNFTTDGTVPGQEIADYTLSLCIDLFQNMKSSLGVSGEVKVIEAPVKKTEDKSSVSSADSIDLPSRVVKILEKNGITSNDVLKARVDEVEEFAGVGAKSFEDIKAYVDSL